MNKNVLVGCVRLSRSCSGQGCSFFFNKENKMLTQAELKEVLEYDPETGIFRWKAPRCTRIKVGDLAGTLTWRGYVRIQLDGKRHQAHRLAWLYVYGEMPTKQIDHINGNCNDNRIINLRDVSNQINSQNRKVRRNKTNSLPLGVYGCKDGRKKPYRAALLVAGKVVHDSYHETPEEAHEAYLAAKAIHHPSSPIISHLI